MAGQVLKSWATPSAGRRTRAPAERHEPVARSAVERRPARPAGGPSRPVAEAVAHQVGADEDRVARPERRRLLFEPLLDLAGLDDDHLLLTWIPVEVMRLCGLERHVEHDELLRSSASRRAPPADHAPAEILVADRRLPDERTHAFPFPVATALKRRSVIAVSVGSRLSRTRRRNPRRRQSARGCMRRRPARRSARRGRDEDSC